jgi:hypothetical protein
LNGAGKPTICETCVAGPEFHGRRKSEIMASALPTNRKSGTIGIRIAVSRAGDIQRERGHARLNVRIQLALSRMRAIESFMKALF